MRLQLIVTVKPEEPYDYELRSFDHDEDDDPLTCIACLSSADAINRLFDWQSLLFAGGVPFTVEVRFD